MATRMIIKTINVSVGLMLFLATGAAWAQTRTEDAKLVASDGAADDLFGYSVAVDGNTAFIGAVRDDDNGENSGAVYVFVRTGTSWTQHSKLTTASDGYFGSSVSLDGDTALNRGRL